MKLSRIGIAALLAWGSLSSGALAFQETTVGGEEPKAPPAATMELPKAAPGTKGLEFSGPALNLGKTQGTEVRIPGIGTVGVLPKLDFGLELLYGANEQKGIPQDQSSPDDVQIRGTIKHRF
jgi:hypothetical protein